MAHLHPLTADRIGKRTPPGLNGACAAAADAAQHLLAANQPYLQSMNTSWRDGIESSNNNFEWPSLGRPRPWASREADALARETRGPRRNACMGPYELGLERCRAYRNRGPIFGLGRNNRRLQPCRRENRS